MRLYCMSHCSAADLATFSIALNSFLGNSYALITRHELYGKLWSLPLLSYYGLTSILSP